MKQEIKEYICPHCNKKFIMARGKFSTHIAYCEKNPKTIINKENISLGVKKYLEKKKQLENESKQEYSFICKCCGKEYKLVLSKNQYDKHKYSKFCSIFCTRKYASSCMLPGLKEANCIDCGKQLFIQKRASVKNCRCDECKIIHSEPLKKCKICGKEFRRRHSICCSKECSEIYKKNKRKYLSKQTLNKFREAGKKSAKLQSEIRRSKNEIKFCKLCEDYFKNVKHNEPIFNGWDADIIIEDIKFGVLWNGPCHYEPIFGEKNLKRVKKRDNIKLKEIKKSGYKTYIIKDVGKHDDNFVNEKFEEFINYIKNI